MIKWLAKLFGSAPAEPAAPAGTDSAAENAVQASWAQLDTWLKTHWPAGYADLNPPASDADILALEQALGARLPADYVASLKVHNGQAGKGGGLIDNADLLSTTAVLQEWNVWKELFDGGEFRTYHSRPDAGVKAGWWNPAWVPITHNGAGDHFCIDLDPAGGGSAGQVITMWHDAGDRKRLAASFSTWFAQYVDAVLRGRYRHSEKFGGLVDVGHL